MTTSWSGDEGVALLIAAGFEVREEQGCLFTTVAQEEGADGLSEWREIRVTSGDNALPGVGTSLFRAVVSNSQAHIKDLVFSSDDARDIAALAIAVRNDQIASAGAADTLAEEDTFIFSETVISNAFADLAFGDWQLDRPPGELSIHLENPRVLYGGSYLAWRDDLAQRLMRATPSAEPPTPGF